MFLEMTAHKDMQHKVSCGLQDSVVQQLDGIIQAFNNWDGPHILCFIFTLKNKNLLFLCYLLISSPHLILKSILLLFSISYTFFSLLLVNADLLQDQE